MVTRYIQTFTTQSIALIKRESLMSNREQLENLIADGMTRILEHSLTLNNKDKQAIAQEYREWLEGVSKSEDIMVLQTRKPS